MATVHTWIPVKCKKCGSIGYKRIERPYIFENPIEIEELRTLTDKYNSTHHRDSLEEPRSITGELIDSCGCDKEEK